MDNMTVEQIAARANQVTDESLESTRRMLQLAEESKETGVKTIVMLDQQGAESRGGRHGPDQPGHEAGREEPDGPLQVLRPLHLSLQQGVVHRERLALQAHVGRRGRTRRREQRRRFQSRLQAAGGRSQRAGRPGQRPAAVWPLRQKELPRRRITNDAREDEMEDNLNAVGGIIGNLKSMAVDMGAEIDKQNKQIDRITDKADMNKLRIDEANQRATKLLN
ncbi:synaptosomal-associated protein 25-like isoform X3 [Syngnathoides biaculeatus]|nr:synaptosomal-associated protein 25-like isoform X3 [Syngnathoides biaculeatus]XP_061698740.1 synaptosomal-associated protein 25-like isoform X3 [Syngnathoides biaculeatus]